MVGPYGAQQVLESCSLQGVVRNLREGDAVVLFDTERACWSYCST